MRGIINPETTGPKTRTTASREPYTPSIDIGNAEPVVPQGGHTAGVRVSMTGEPVGERPKGSRELVRISDILPEDKNAPKEIPGVTLLESPQAEILKPGGPFEKYVEEKKEEMKRRMEQEDAKREVEENATLEDQTDNEIIPEEKMDDDEKEILAAQDTAYTAGINVEVKSVRRPDETTAMQTLTTEIGLEPMVEAEDLGESQSVNPEDMPKETPFYTGTRFKDDFDYPKDYGNLPTDEEEYIEEEKEMQGNETEVTIETPVEVKAPHEIEEPVVSGQIAPVEEEAVVEPTTEAETEPVTIEQDHRDLTAKNVKVSITTDEQSLEDLEKELGGDDELTSDDDRMEELKSEITKKIKPKAKSLSLEGFTVANKATVSNKIFDMTSCPAGKWVLPATGITFQMREISGQKIEYLRENMGNNPTMARNRLKTMYDHIVTPKPASFEAWTKSIAFADRDHLFMGAFMAAFSDSNYMPQTCIQEPKKIPRKETGCGHMFLTDNIDIMRCVKFTSDENKKKFWDLYDSDRTNSEGLYASEIIPISERFAFAFVEPTLYSVMLEGGSYGSEFSAKYSDTISLMPYIGKIYFIDQAHKKLVEVKYQEFANNAAKTAKSKVIRYDKVIGSLKTDEYTNLVSIINSINEIGDWMTYVVPEMTCPKCGRTIPEEDISASGLVFTRHRLGVLANTSIK